MTNSAALVLLDLVKLLERSLIYEIHRSELGGDDEGANLKRMTLHEVRLAIEEATK